MNITDSRSTLARETPEAPAVLTTEATLNYRELDQAVSWVARSYLEEGLKPGDIVGIQLGNQIQHMIAFLARLGAGQFAFHSKDPLPVRQEQVRLLEIAAIIADGSGRSGFEAPIIAPPSDSLGDYKELGPQEFAASEDGELPL